MAVSPLLRFVAGGRTLELVPKGAEGGIALLDPLRNWVIPNRPNFPRLGFALSVAFRANRCEPGSGSIVITSYSL